MSERERLLARVTDAEIGYRPHAVGILLADVRDFLASLSTEPMAQEGGEQCATDGCGKRATEYFEAYDIGTYYCADCAAQVRGLAFPAPVQQGGEVAGEYGTMSGTSGFTMATFRAIDVPVGTKLYAHPVAPSEEVTDEMYAAARETWPEPWQDYNLRDALRAALVAALQTRSKQL